MIGLIPSMVSTGCQLTSEKLEPGHWWWCLEVKIWTLCDGRGIDKDAVVEMVALKHIMVFRQNEL